MEGVLVAVAEAVDDTEETGALQKGMKEECIAEIKGYPFNTSFVIHAGLNEVLRNFPIRAGVRIEGEQPSFPVAVYAFLPVDHKSQVLVFIAGLLALPGRDGSGCIFVVRTGINDVHILTYPMCLYSKTISTL